MQQLYIEHFKATFTRRAKSKNMYSIFDSMKL